MRINKYLYNLIDEVYKNLVKEGYKITSSELWTFYNYVNLYSDVNVPEYLLKYYLEWTLWVLRW